MIRKEHGDFMQQVFRSNPNYNNGYPQLNIQTKFFLNGKYRLSMIIWYYATKEDGTREDTWGNETQEKWDLEEANGYDLTYAFKELARKNPKDFKTLYYTLKEHDEVTFPYIQEALQQVKESYNFD